MSERKFSKAFRAILTQYNLRPHAIENKIMPGMPDILVCRSGKEPIWIELKIRRVGLSTNQLLWRSINPEEIVMLVTRVETTQQFKLSLWNREINEWDILHEDTWPLRKPKDMTEAIYNGY